MSISYSGITNYGKVTLPSVDSWGTDMNILRDPPKSISTRRIDKVGQTSSITETIDESENRAAECILPYARGVNPSVSVSYSNNSNNGGQFSSGMGLNYNSYGGPQSSINNNGPSFNYNLGSASLPYKLTDSFRPPVLSQWDLQPLSRLPRIWTSSFTKPGFSDFSKKMKSCGNASETKEVKNNLLKTSARPTAVYKIETPLKEQPFEVKYLIQPSLTKSYQASKNSGNRTQQNVLIPTKQINDNNLHISANSNMRHIKNSNNSEINKENYIINKNNTPAFTNIKSNYTQIGSIEDIMDSSNIKIKDTLIGNYNTNVRGNNKSEYIHDDIELSRVIPEYNYSSNIRGNDKNEYIHSDIELSRVLPEYTSSTNFRGNEKTDYIHSDIELSRVIPEYNYSTNIKQNQEKRIEHDYIKEYERNIPLTNLYVNSSKKGDSNMSSRDYKLNQKISAGGFEVPIRKPSQNRIQSLYEPFQTEKSRMVRSVMQQFEGRYK